MMMMMMMMMMMIMMMMTPSDHHDHQEDDESPSGLTRMDLQDPAKRTFIADAIISNPVTYGHIHCAEALSVPLHIMFPQPW
jgi:hypothetical protein